MEKCEILIKDSIVVKPQNYFFGYVAIQDGKIKKVGRGKSDLRGEVEIKNRIVTPGFVNLHTHVPMVLLRGLGEDAELEEWLTKIIWPIEKKLTPSDIYISSKFAFLEMLKSGTIFFNDMYFFPKAIAKAMKEIGIKGVISCVVLNDEKPIKEAILLNKKFKKEKGIKISLGPHSEYSCSKEVLKEVASVSKEYNIPIHFHYAESEKLLKKVKKEIGNPLEVYDSFGFLSERLTIAHAIHLTKKDIFLLSKRNVNVAYNATSNMKLSQGIARISYMKKKVNIGIGTDGAASNNSLDIIREAKIAVLLQKLFFGAKALTAKEAFEMLTKNGSKAIGFENEIEENKDANLVLFKASEEMLPLYDPYASIIYSASSKDVSEVIIDGKIVVKNGRIRNEERIKKDFEKLANRFAPVAQW
ncbi:MAG: amidohydrolase [Candidatus Micrarchaeia archaeon]